MLQRLTERNSELRQATVQSRISQDIYSVQLPNGQQVRAKVTGQDAFITDQVVTIDRTRNDQQWTIVTRSPEGQPTTRMPDQGGTQRKRPLRRQEEDPGQGEIPTPERLLLLADKCYSVSTSGGTVATSAAFSSLARAGVLSADGRTLYALLTGGGFATIDTRTLAITRTMDTTAVPYEVADYAQVAYDENGWLWYHSGSTLRRLNVLSGECNFVLLTPNNSMWPYGVCYDADTDEIYAVHPGDATHSIWRINRTTGAVIATHARANATAFANWQISAEGSDSGRRAQALGISTSTMKIAALKWDRTTHAWDVDEGALPNADLPTSSCRPTGDSLTPSSFNLPSPYGTLIDPASGQISYRFYATYGDVTPQVATAAVSDATASVRGPAIKPVADGDDVMYYSRGTVVDEVAPDLTVTRSFTATGITASSPIFYVPAFG